MSLLFSDIVLCIYQGLKLNEHNNLGTKLLVYCWNSYVFLIKNVDSRFLDKASVETQSDTIKESPSPWRLCTVTQVQELKAIIRLLPVWALLIVFATVYSQMSTMFVLQGNTMDQHIGPHFEIPSASLSLFDTLSVLFWTPVYDLIIVPYARKITGHERGFTQLQRIGIGLVISIISMIAAGILEVVRLGIVRRHNYDDLKSIPMSIFWQVPQYFLVGCAEVFTNIGQMEFFYAEAPDAMRSLCTALALTTNALGSYLSTLLVSIVTKVTERHGKLGWIPDNLNRGHLDYFYWLLAILSFINFVAFVCVSKMYTYKNVAGHNHWGISNSLFSTWQKRTLICKGLVWSGLIIKDCFNFSFRRFFVTFSTLLLGQLLHEELAFFSRH